jgi:hypothetical protein
MPSAKPILLSCAGALLLGSSLYAADIGNDLKATIVLQGLACDQVAQQTCHRQRTDQGAWPYTILPPNMVKITAALLSSSAGIVSTSRSIKVRSARLPALIEPISDN